MTRIPQPEIENQRAIMSRIRSSSVAGAGERYALVDTYGCQQNEADSERLRGMLREMGFILTRDERDADVIVMNTCAVREHAENRVFGNIGALSHNKRAKPELIIAVCGCMAQRDEVARKIRESYRHVDIVFGPHALWRFPEMLERVMNTRRRVFDDSAETDAIAEGLPISRDKSVTSWLSIMYGCDNFCSYCIVPHVRGRERSREPESILREARDIIEAGYRDITLLGQNVNSYGRGLSEDLDFPRLLRMINGLDGEFLIRFMTSHPKDASAELFLAMAECEKVAKHIHLPFQAGADRVLRAMNRGYTAEEYLSLVDMARRYMPDIVITSDVIVGFPGETYEDFAQTLSLIRRARFDALFTFIYSKRPGTPASTLPDPVPRGEKQRWFDELLAVQDAISAEQHAAYVGKTVRVLVGGDDGDDDYPLRARTNGGRLVHLRGVAAVGAFTDAKITRSNTWALFGETVN